MHNNDLRKLIEHIDKGGDTVRQLDPRTGRIISVPVVEGEIGRKIGSAIGSVFGDAGAKFGGDMGDRAGDALDRLNPFSKDSDQDKSKTTAPVTAVPKPPGDFQYSTIGGVQYDTPEKEAKRKALMNPNGNNGHDDSNIAPDADPADPKTWPPGVKAAPDFGYLDANGMWIPTPFHFRTEEGKWRVPKNSPANLIGIPMNQWTPFQQKLEQLKSKNTSNSGSAIEKQQPMQLPGGAPQIPGYTPIDPKRFSTDAREPGLNKTLDWLYAYQKGKNIVLIAPMLFPGMKLSIGRFYQGWDDNIGNIRSGYGALKTQNGTIHVSGLSFNYKDMIFDVVVHSTDPKVGPQVLQSISGSLKPV
jgi:hypothetical protein